jgi:hypothetical protein
MPFVSYLLFRILRSSSVLGLDVVVLRVTKLALLSCARLLLRPDLVCFTHDNNRSHEFVKQKFNNTSNAVTFSASINNLELQPNRNVDT